MAAVAERKRIRAPAMTVARRPPASGVLVRVAVVDMSFSLPAGRSRRLGGNLCPIRGLSVAGGSLLPPEAVPSVPVRRRLLLTFAALAAAALVIWAVEPLH